MRVRRAIYWQAGSFQNVELSFLQLLPPHFLTDDQWLIWVAKGSGVCDLSPTQCYLYQWVTPSLQLSVTAIKLHFPPFSLSFCKTLFCLFASPQTFLTY